MVLQVEGDVELQEEVKADTAKDSGPKTSVSIVMIEFCAISESQSKTDVGTDYRINEVYHNTKSICFSMRCEILGNEAVDQNKHL